MADKSTRLVLDALSRAVAEPAGLPLHGSKMAPGLFPGTPHGKHAARRCLDEGWLRLERKEPRGKAVLEVCALTEKGLAHLVRQANPRQVLEDLVRALEARQNQVGELVAAAQQTQASMAALKSVAERVLEQMLSQPTNGTAGSPGWPEVVLDHLAGWQRARASEDCPLPELYQTARQAAPSLTIGCFHDGLRQLYEHEQIYLHPWTGPLCDIPEPPCALLIGHEIAYYASRRCA